MKKLLLTILFIFISSQVFAGTITRGKIGKEDFQLFDGLTGTFTRPTSSGGTATLHNLDYGGIDVLQVYGDGTTCSDATIRNAINQVGSTEVALNLGRCTWTLTASLTINANTTLIFQPGGKIQGTAGGATETITINGGIIASPGQQIFGNNITPGGSPKIPYIYPEWFGVDGTADQTEINAAITWGNGNIPVQLTGAYVTNGTINVNIQGASLGGTSMDGTTISYSGASYALIMGGNGAGQQNYQSLRDFRIVGSASGAGGIKLTECSRFTIKNVYSGDFTNGNGILFYDDVWIGEVVSSYFKDNSKGVFVDRATGTNQSFNAIVFHGQGEIGDNAIGVQIGTVAGATGTVHGSGSVFRDYTIEGNTTGGILAIYGARLVFENLYLQNPGADYDIQLGDDANTSAITDITIRDNYISSSSTVGIVCEKVQWFTITRNYFNNQTTGWTRTSNTTRGHIYDNRFLTTVPTVVSGTDGGEVYFDRELEWDVTIADDAATYIPIPSATFQNGIILIRTNGNFRGQALIGYVATSTAQTVDELGISTNVETTTGALAGTTGTDAKITISPHYASGEGRIYLENRSGESLVFTWRFLYGKVY